MNLELARLKYRKDWKPRRPFMQSLGAPAQLQTAPEDMSHKMRLMELRKHNFKRHVDYENQLKLADSKRRYQALQTDQTEYDRLLSASSHGLLTGRAHQRMEDLMNLVGIRA